jgi:DNA-binding SARP family transcriptional activator/TolB-like protein/cytochrome c-type biogenesis protein CcmH/NrfG
MANWQLELFGEFHLASKSGEPITALGRRDRALLVYLALTSNQRESRERLAALLWSTRGDEQARHSLAQSTAVLRKALSDAAKTIVQSEQATLTIDGTQFDVDVLAFRRLVEVNTIESLQAAVALYSDDLLAGFEVRSEGFDEWITGERARLRTLAVDAHARLTSLLVQADDWQAAIDMANRTLALDNLREDAHRLLMRAYAQSSQRALALQQYKTLTDVLHSELQVAPDAETEALIEAIKSGRLSNGYSEQAAMRPDTTPQSPAGEADGFPIAPPHPVPIRGGQSGQVSRPVRNKLYWGVGGLVVILLAVVIGVTATFWRVPELAPAPIGAYVRDIKTTLQPHPLSIAILPFENHGDSESADFAEALSGRITTALSISSEMRVISRSEARRFEDAETTGRKIAKELKVRYLLEGSVNKWGDQISIETGLIDTQQGQHRIWSEAYRRQAADFIQFQQDVTFDIIKSLEIRLTEGEQERITRMGGTQSLEAWLAAARGEKHLRQLNPQDNLIARASYQRALKLDPNYAGAMEGLAWTYFVSARFGWTAQREEAVTKAFQLGEQTLALERDRPQIFSLLGSLSLLVGDFSKAVELGEQAFSLDPNDSDVAALLAYTLTYTGEPERAISLIDRAINLRPVSPAWYGWLRGRAYRQTGRYDDAIKVLTAATRETPTSPLPLIELAAAYSETGKARLAKRTADEVMRLSPRFTVGAWISLSPYEDEDALEQEVAALRATGLPN